MLKTPIVCVELTRVQMLACTIKGIKKPIHQAGDEGLDCKFCIFFGGEEWVENVRYFGCIFINCKNIPTKDNFCPQIHSSDGDS